MCEAYGPRAVRIINASAPRGRLSLSCGHACGAASVPSRPRAPAGHARVCIALQSPVPCVQLFSSSLGSGCMAREGVLEALLQTVFLLEAA